MFAREHVVWHGAVDRGPSNHLLDSQVQCVNALAPGLTDPEFVRTAFGDVLPIAEALPVEADRFVGFEYIGAADHLHEGHGKPRARGSMATSADAAIRYRTPAGHVEMALVEWKFTEDYRAGTPLPPERFGSRADRYLALWDAPDSVVARDVIPYDDLFVEPWYQLLRQQLLAAAMERAGELDADVVRVVHVCPRANLGVRAALTRDSHRSAGTDVLGIWTRLCGTSGRFISIDSDRFVDLRGGGYAARYDITVGAGDGH